MAQSLHWQKSSFSGGADGNECVELAAANGEPLLRESDEPDRILPVTRHGLAALLHHLRANRP
ncbi:DUF397 domain-containing protein [Streptomyces phaeochromogenes]|uniref:DUF397 domain-containing protein n=1 Tax=Streptomyces phaeochromogenes TaxID=1923 RepID=UPI003867B46E|nr:DUF397 domain-containing protein [Streptomyces phaeochromogenes]